MQLAGGTHPTFATYWPSMKAAASALFPSHPEVATYVECVAKRRALDKCDRTVPVYRGESKVQYVRLRYSPFQISFTADDSATGSIALCSARGTSTTIYLRKGQPVAITAVDPQTLNATVTYDVSFTMAQACQAGAFTLTLDATDAGTWYMMFDSPGAFLGSTPGDDIYKVTASGAGVVARGAASAPATCAPPTATTQDPGTTSPSPGKGGGGGGCGTGEGAASALCVLLVAALLGRVRRGGARNRAEGRA